MSQKVTREKAKVPVKKSHKKYKKMLNKELNFDDRPKVPTPILTNPPLESVFSFVSQFIFVFLTSKVIILAVKIDIFTGKLLGLLKKL